MALVCAVLLLLTGALALLTPPNNGDCLCYHLPRQVFWASQGGVWHFPATDLRQLEMPPLAEFIGVHLMLLSGNDHQANMVQWAAYAMSALAGASVARALGAGTRGQWLAALLLLTQPMAAIQALNPKNDVVCSFFALMTLYSAAELMRRPNSPWIDRFLFASSVGLMILTKGTGLLLALPMLVLVGVRLLRVLRMRALLPGAVMAIIAVGVNAGHWTRNYRAFESPLAADRAHGGFAISNEAFGPPAIASNIIRNLSLHVGTPWPSVNKQTQQLMERAHEALGIAINDPRTTYLPGLGVVVWNRWNLDDGASAPIHVGLLLALFIAAVLRRYRAALDARLLCWAGVTAGLLFCIVLKWQPWHARLHLPFFALLLPHGALWMESWRGAAAVPLRRVVAGLCSLLAGAAVLYNQMKPVLGPDSVLHTSRSEIAFRSHVSPRKATENTAKRIAALGPRCVGLLLPAYSDEYLLMREVLNRVGPNVRLVNLNYGWVEPSRDQPEPQVVIARGPDASMSHEYKPTGTWFDTSAIYGPFCVQYPGARPREWATLDELPAFSGWEATEGLNPPEGPYPQWDFPVVRWAQVPRTRLTFQSDGEPMLLRMECRRGERNDQIVTIKLNARELARWRVGSAWTWRPIEVPLVPAAGANVLELEYLSPTDPQSPHSVLFRRIQLVRASWIKGTHESPAR